MHNLYVMAKLLPLPQIQTKKLSGAQTVGRTTKKSGKQMLDKLSSKALVKMQKKEENVFLAKIPDFQKNFRNVFKLNIFNRYSVNCYAGIKKTLCSRTTF